ncbi:MAG: hypothetical protein LBH44_00395 [Treponema sp.]|jgi:hypothetical protein|nr:hypothetical protein [Treponema sp.]
MAEKKEAKAKKEKKFNSERIVKQVKNALKAVFPKDNFTVSSFVDRVEILYFENTACSATELNMFCTLFCNMGNIKKEQLQLFKAKKEPAVVPASAK